MLPTLVHQIWLGKPDDRINKLQAQVKRHLKNWEHLVWRDEDVEALTAPAYFEGALGKTTLWTSARSLAMRADIARYLIVEQYGGLYLDSDFLLLRELPSSWSNFDLVLAAENYWFTNSMFGSQRGHELLRQMNTQIWASQPSGPEVIGELIFAGPIRWTRLIAESDWHLDHKTFLLPSSFFVLDGSYDKKVMTRKERLIKDRNGYPVVAVGVHLYDDSWSSRLGRSTSRLLRSLKLLGSRAKRWVDWLRGG